MPHKVFQGYVCICVFDSDEDMMYNLASRSVYLMNVEV